MCVERIGGGLGASGARGRVCLEGARVPSARLPNGARIHPSSSARIPGEGRRDFPSGERMNSEERPHEHLVRRRTHENSYREARDIRWRDRQSYQWIEGCSGGHRSPTHRSPIEQRADSPSPRRPSCLPTTTQPPTQLPPFPQPKLTPQPSHRLPPTRLPPRRRRPKTKRQEPGPRTGQGEFGARAGTRTWCAWPWR